MSSFLPICYDMGMRKSKINIDLILILLGATWFVMISYILAHTEYNSSLASSLTDPKGTSIGLANLLSISFVIISFLPGGYLLAYVYIKKYQEKQNIIRILLLSLVLCMAWYVVYSWYNFIVNFS